MALPATLLWEIRGGAGGAAANGGGFNPGNANFPTDAAATSATGNSPVISSATYSFVAGDVGAWIYIKAGTDWTPGWYQIASVASNNATVNAAIGQAVQVTNGVYHTNTVAGCATTASPTGGTYGVDYSQQASAKLSITDAASLASSTNLTSATAAFTPVMVGNLFHLTTTGTGGFGIIGWYEIVSFTDATTVVTDVTTNTGTALVAGTGAVGGAISTIGAIGSATARLGPVAGNIVWMNGAFTLTTSVEVLAFDGTTTLPISVIGYGTTRGDGDLGRTDDNGTLDTTNMPTITYTTGRLSGSGASFCQWKNLNVTGAPNNAVITTGTESEIYNCNVVNSGTGASAATIAPNARNSVINCDMRLTGASGTTAALDCGNSSNVRVEGCRIIGGPSVGIIIVGSTPFISGCVVYGSASHGIAVTNTGGILTAIGNTIVGNGGDGINIITGNTVSQVIGNNMITDNGGAGINCVSTGNQVIIFNNRFRDNTGGNIANAGEWVLRTSYGNVTTDTGGPETDYVDESTDDYNLISTSPGAYAAMPAYASMGAFQRPQDGGGGGAHSYASA